jgi:hypothetical protein
LTLISNGRMPPPLLGGATNRIASSPCGPTLPLSLRPVAVV